MIGDIIDLKPQYYEPAAELITHLLPIVQAQPRTVIAVAGESGSGKTVLALCLQHLLATANIKAIVLHQDDYFRLPPNDNHAARLANIQNVGRQEVRTDLLEAHISQYKNGETYLHKPLVDYPNNSILAETITLTNSAVLIVEGTYSLSLSGADTRIFMSRNYLETQAQRAERAREASDDFIETVLAIEHLLIAPTAQKADFIINKNYTVVGA